jgi:hypothetical protein
MSDLLRDKKALHQEGGAASAAAPARSTVPAPPDDPESPLVTPPPAETVSTSPRPQTSATNAAAASTPLFTSAETADLRARWDSIQVGFVDEPRRAVQEADALVSSTTKRLADFFAGERQKLERQWDRGTDISTEDLRLTLHRYRSFFTRLLSV